MRGFGQVFGAFGTLGTESVLAPPSGRWRHGSARSGLDVRQAAGATAAEVLSACGTSEEGLPEDEAAGRLEAGGPNAVRSHRARAGRVLARQLRSPLLLLLAVTALVSYFVGERRDAILIGAILAMSVGLGFVNEYRAARAAEAMRDKVRHTSVVRRGGSRMVVPVTELVVGDVVELSLGTVVPADIRLISSTALECDESIVTGESLPVEKSSEPAPPGAGLGDLTSAALMGTVVTAGSGVGVVVATGSSTVFGRIAVELGREEPETAFQVGLRQFSLLLVEVAAVLTVAIFVINLVLRRPFIDALLFSLAISVGVSPQLLPAVVSTSLAAGASRLAKEKVLVKRLVCIEDLGDIQVLFTDKTGTLTEGRLRFMRSIGADGASSDLPFLLGLLCNDAKEGGAGQMVGNPLDIALWNSAASLAVADRAREYRRIGELPFDHERAMASVVVTRGGETPVLVTKGAPEAVLARSVKVPPAMRRRLRAEFAAGNRVVAIATRPFTEERAPLPSDERDLVPAGLLVFLDPPKGSAGSALGRLAGLGIQVKLVTGDNAAVARRVCDELGLPVAGVVNGADLEELAEEDLPGLIGATTIFARVSPEQKARIVRAQRQLHSDVAFLGDGVNDALALQAADVGISVETATDVAKDAADVLLLEKDLDVLADGVVGGRRVFANTMKYVLMGTSSNFGNMFSAAGASAFLSFLPMLPPQILLNNLLYDASQLSIPTDSVDREQLLRPSHWDVRFIRRFMLFFGPISSIFDFLTFGVMLQVFGAGPTLFRTGWFVESLATQTLVIFAIRTRRIPFWRSRPSIPLLLAALAAVGTGAVLPFTPLASDLGFSPLPAGFFLALAAMVAIYIGLIEAGKRWFYRSAPAALLPSVTARPARKAPARGARRRRRVNRRAARFSSARRRRR